MQSDVVPLKARALTSSVLFTTVPVPQRFQQLQQEVLGLLEWNIVN